MLVYRVLHDDLHWKPYKLHHWHKLEPHDYEQRVNFAQWFLSKPPETKEFFICSDEAYFTLTLPVNKQNNRMWAPSSPYDGIEVPLNDKKILVWCAISAKFIFGPYFFSDNVNQYNYLEMVQNFFWSKLLRTANYKKYYFQQDGATSHTAKLVQEWFQDKMADKFLNKKMWPPRSPDLNPADFYLWAYLKTEQRCTTSGRKHWKI